MRALVDLLDEAPREQVRDALSQLQMLYVRETPGRRRSRMRSATARAADPPEPPPGPGPGGPEPPPRLWTPPGSS